MSGRDDPRLPARTVDYIQDIVGADVPRDLIKVALVAQDLGQLDVSAAEVDVNLNNQSLAQVASNIEQIGGQAQSAVDVANKIDQINAALASVGNDSLRVTSPNPLDVSAAEVDVDIATQSLTPLTVTDNGSLSLAEYTGGNLPISLEAQNVTPLTVTDGGSLAISAYNGNTLPVEQQTAVAVEDSDGTGIDPLAQRDLPIGTDPATGAENSLRNQTEFDLSYVGSAIADGNEAFVVVLNNPGGSGVEAFGSIQINGSGLAELDKAEDIAIDSAGTALDAIPKNTQSGETPTITVEQGGTYTVNGTEISTLTSGSVAGGGTNQSSGGISPLDSGFRLPQGTSRLYRVTNASGSESSYAIDIKLKEIDNA